MYRKLEGVHVGFLRRITRQRAVQNKDGTKRQVAADTVLDKAGNQPLRTYIVSRQATKGEWMALCHILEVCDREKNYKGVGRR